MTQEVPYVPVADWYPDPQGQGALRYWDGSKWTDHLHTQPGLVKAAENPPSINGKGSAPVIDESIQIKGCGIVRLGTGSTRHPGLCGAALLYLCRR
jgi:hypothetical protein